LGCALLCVVEAVACGGTVKVELGAGGATSRAEGGTGNAGAFAPAGGSGNTGNVASGAGSAASGEGGKPSAFGSAGASIGDAGMFGVAGEPGVSACEVDGVVHPVGKPFACDCNTCWCEFDGTISSTLRDCAVCTYMGEIQNALPVLRTRFLIRCSGASERLARSPIASGKPSVSGERSPAMCQFC